ncbi:hypothetical protein JHU38_06880 [Prevotella sp. A2931]|uniref:GP-PDE domain-containing protein n=1 Tax=Prevotella illustrans TaxID=2800387 RepID=A0ABS3M5P1_9BACT|nr:MULTISPECIES: SGNH/GDSL hydrolase family protein [Prevotella]MBO1363497.1 hypothetical protein [Prevotella illustrans]PTL25969.1 hypothetical protein C3V39_02115 [Prevotella sp. oral taxon 820]
MKTRSILVVLGLVLSSVLSAQIKWFSPMSGSVPAVFGRAWNAEIGNCYDRLPERLRASVPKAVWELSHHGSGLSVRFVTDARNIYIRYGLADARTLHNMSDINSSGVDLYARTGHGRYHWVGNHMNYSFGKTEKDTLETVYKDLSVKGSTEYELYLPNYNSVKWLEVGVDEGCNVEFKSPAETMEKPIVVYGSSIIQGASPSRPGLSITNIVSRILHKPFVNLGFSGSCYMEPEMFKALAEIDAQAYVVDPIPNSWRLDAATVKSRVAEGVKLLRQKSNAPILLVENHELSDSVMHAKAYKLYRRGNEALCEAYKELKKEGVDNLYLLPHDRLDLTEDGMIEGVHPNDIGSMIYAQAYANALKAIVGPKIIAHRGYWDTEGSAQNSIASLMKADSIHCYGSEFDIHVTADGRLVINHDDTIDGIVIEDAKWKDIIDRKLVNGERRPLLHEYLAAGKNCTTRLVLEIKAHKSEKKENLCVDEAVKAVKVSGIADRVDYISFSKNVCRRLAKKLKGANIAYLNGDATPDEVRSWGCNGIDYHYKVLKKHPEWIRRSHELGMTVNVWTVNKPKDIKYFIEAGVDFITTNNPVEGLQQIGKMDEPK